MTTLSCHKNAPKDTPPLLSFPFQLNELLEGDSFHPPLSSSNKKRFNSPSLLSFELSIFITLQQLQTLTFSLEPNSCYYVM